MRRTGRALGRRAVLEGLERRTLMAAVAVDPGAAGPATYADVAPIQSSVTERFATRVEVGTYANPISYGQTVILGAAIRSASNDYWYPDPNSPTVPTGEVTFFADGQVIGTSHANGGMFWLYLYNNPLLPGVHAITASYAGDANNQPSASTDPYAYTVQPLEATTWGMVLEERPVFGDSMTLRAFVSQWTYAPNMPAPTGTVTFRVGDTVLGQGQLAGGEVEVSAVATKAGDLFITTEYSGDSIYAPATGGVFVHVYPDSTTVAVTSSPAPVVGEELVLTATVSGDHSSAVPTGNVVFIARDAGRGMYHEWGAPLVDGVATVSVSDLPGGTYDLTANYNGDFDIPWERQEFEPNQAPHQALTVNPGPLTIQAGSPMTEIRWGQELPVGALVPAPRETLPLPTGEVWFMEGDAVLGSGFVEYPGTASTWIEGLSVGVHEIRAVYQGDANYQQATSDPITVTVDPLTASIWGFVQPNNVAVYGQPLTLHGFLSFNDPRPGGTILFRLGDRVLGQAELVDNGPGSVEADLEVSDLPAGTEQLVTLDYSGDGIYAPGTGGLIVSIFPADTTTTLFASSTSATLGQSLTIRADVATVAPGGGSAAGEVEFWDSSTLLGVADVVDGVATFVTGPLGAGQHQFGARYRGDDTHRESFAEPLTVAIAPATTSVSLTSSANPVVADNPVTLRAFVAVEAPAAGVAAGTVTFLDGSTLLGTADVGTDGAANFTTSTLAVGSHSITAVYGGAANFAGATSAALALAVNYPTGTTVAGNQTATVSWWNANSKGQSLIRAFNGGPNATALGNWLAATLPNVFGANAPAAHNLTGRTNAQVADYFHSIASTAATGLRTEVLALSLSVYATTQSLGGDVAGAYGFAVSRWGVLIATWNVRDSGPAFGVANNSTVAVHLILGEVNGRVVNGILYGGNLALRTQANDTIEAINRAGRDN